MRIVYFEYMACGNICIVQEGIFMKNIAVIFGGKSQEHEVSCHSAAAVLQHIDKSKYSKVKFGITKD